MGRDGLSAGIRPEDVILAAGGVGVADMGALQRVMTGDSIGRRITLEVARAGEVLRVDVTLAEFA
ncbi:MAG TPA: PDZ domain-containing protein [Acidimicrobiia bacterium]|nr:PDZ domain-containing protein [Acidimicrobiia bacterium]